MRCLEVSEHDVESKKFGTVSIRPDDMSREWGEGGNNHRGEIKKGHKPGRLPICPYGCGREGTLLEIVMTDDGRAIGIFNDHPCSCVFTADIEVGEPPTKKKYKVDVDGELREVEAS
jgi:hypothetical protein